MAKTYKPKRKVYTRKTTMKYKRKSVPKVKQLIKQEIARNVENKTFQYIGNPGVSLVPSNSAGFDGTIVPCSPFNGYLDIQQGVTQGSRLGNRIKIKKLTVGGVIFPLPYNATTNLTPCPLQIKMWFFYDKEEPQALPTPALSGDILQFGSSSVYFGNQLFDHSMPINTDRYRVLTTRTFKLGYAEYLGTGTQPQSGNFSNNDFKLNTNFKVDLTKYCVKNVVYRDTATNPTTRGIYMMCQPVYANGNTIANNQIVARMSYMLNVDYEDA